MRTKIETLRGQHESGKGKMVQPLDAAVPENAVRPSTLWLFWCRKIRLQSEEEFHFFGFGMFAEKEMVEHVQKLEPLIVQAKTSSRTPG